MWHPSSSSSDQNLEPPPLWFHLWIDSLPTGCDRMVFSAFQGLAMDDFATGKLAATGKELMEERDEALAVCQD